MSDLREHPVVRKTVRTFLQAFLGLCIPGALGWLNSLTQWATSEGQTPLPDARSLAYLGVAAIASGFIAAITAIQNYVEEKSGKTLL